MVKLINKKKNKKEQQLLLLSIIGIFLEKTSTCTKHSVYTWFRFRVSLKSLIVYEGAGPSSTSSEGPP